MTTSRIGRTAAILGTLLCLAIAPALAITGDTNSNVSTFFTNWGMPIIDTAINSTISFLGGPMGWIIGLGAGVKAYQGMRDAQEHGEWINRATLGFGAVAAAAGGSSMYSYFHKKADAAAGLSVAAMHHVAPVTHALIHHLH